MTQVTAGLAPHSAVTFRNKRIRLPAPISSFTDTMDESHGNKLREAMCDIKRGEETGFE